MNVVANHYMLLENKQMFHDVFLASLPLDMRSVSRVNPLHIAYFFNLHYSQNIDLFTSKKVRIVFCLLP